MLSRAERGRQAVAKRKFRPVSAAVQEQVAEQMEPQLCGMSCGFKLSSLKRDRDCGRLRPCGHQFCFSARMRGACPGIHDVVMQHALEQHAKCPTDRNAFPCPICRDSPTALERIGPKTIVERVALPIILDAEEVRYLRSTPRQQWFVKVCIDTCAKVLRCLLRYLLH